MQSNRVRTSYHTVYPDLLVNACEIFLTNILDLYDFTGIDFLTRINSGANSLLLRPINTLQQIRGKLCLAYFSILPLAKHIIHEDNEIIYFSNLRLF